MSTPLFLFAIIIRIVLLGFERVFLKLLGKSFTEDYSLAITTVFFGFGSLALLPFAIMHIEISEMYVFPIIASIFYSFAFYEIMSLIT